MLTVHTVHPDSTTICNTTEACANGIMGPSTLLCQQGCPDNNCSIVQSCAAGILQNAVVICNQCKGGTSCPASASITTDSSTGPTFGTGGSASFSTAQLVQRTAQQPSAQSLGVITKPVPFDPALPAINNRLVYSFTPSKGPLDGKEITLYVYNEQAPQNNEQIVSLYAQLSGQKPVTIAHLSAVNRTVTKLSELYAGSQVYLSPEGKLLIYHAPRAPKFLNVEKILTAVPKEGSS